MEDSIKGRICWADFAVLLLWPSVVDFEHDDGEDNMCNFSFASYKARCRDHALLAVSQAVSTGESSRSDLPFKDPAEKKPVEETRGCPTP